MALITTLGSATAEAYRTIADHKTYCDNRGISYAAYTDTQLEQHARKAVAYMTQAWGQKWAGYRVDNTQSLDWPRSYVAKPAAAIPSTYVSYYLNTEIPAVIGDAQSELMIRVASAALAPDLTRAAVRKKVGPLEIEYDTNSPEAPRYRAVEMMLRPVLKTGGSSMVGLTRS